MISGWASAPLTPLPALMVVWPRIRMWTDAPGSPELEVTVTFGALAASALTMLGSALRTMESESILLRPVPIFSTSLAVPAPVTTISPNCRGLSARVKSWLAEPLLRLTWAERALYPTSRAVTVTGGWAPGPPVSEWI